MGFWAHSDMTCHSHSILHIQWNVVEVLLYQIQREGLGMCFWNLLWFPNFWEGLTHLLSPVDPKTKPSSSTTLLVARDGWITATHWRLTLSDLFMQPIQPAGGHEFGTQTMSSMPWLLMQRNRNLDTYLLWDCPDKSPMRKWLCARHWSCYGGFETGATSLAGVGGSHVWR